MYTRCPHCETVFRVTPQQLQASSGQVRCGRCREVFDAFSTLSAQLPGSTAAPDTPFSVRQTSSWVDSRLEDATGADSETPPARAYGSPLTSDASSAGQRSVQSDAEVRSAGPRQLDTTALAEADSPARSSPPVKAGDAKLIDAPASRLGNDDQDASKRNFARTSESSKGTGAGSLARSSALPRAEDDLTLPDELFTGATSGRARQGWTAANSALFALALTQLGWVFATPIANTLPVLRDPLEAFCRWSGCRVALPRLPDQLFIEASDLQVLDASRPYEVLLTATIRNRADLAQAFPLLELTLTGPASQTTARRVFAPQEYLERGIDPARGIGANQEILVRLYLNTSGVQASGYRLYLFFA